MHRSSERHRLIAVAAVAVLAVAACSDDDPRTLPPPSSTSSTEPPSTTTTIDYGAIALDPVPGQTTTSLAVAGSVVFTGLVEGPDGPVSDALVRLDRLVADAAQPFQTRTIEDGTFELTGLPGGRYRIRAAVPPELTMPEPVIVYVEDGAEREVRLQLQPHVGLTTSAGTTPPAPIVGDTLNLAVQVLERFVDPDGVGRTRPVRNVPVRIQQSGWTEVEDPVDTTDDDGFVVIAYRCDEVGPVTARAIVGTDRRMLPLEVPDCAPVPESTSSSTSTP